MAEYSIFKLRSSVHNEHMQIRNCSGLLLIAWARRPAAQPGVAAPSPRLFLLSFAIACFAMFRKCLTLESEARIRIINTIFKVEFIFVSLCFAMFRKYEVTHGLAIFYFASFANCRVMLWPIQLPAFGRPGKLL